MQEDAQILGSRGELISLTKLRHSLPSHITSALLMVHALTGCDTVSSFAGKGKRKALKLIQDLGDCAPTKTLAKLRQDFTLTDEVYAAIECFVCRLYRASTDPINEARYKLFCLAVDMSERSLPPTLDALRQHAMRAAYQHGIWLRVLKPIMDAPTPCGHGWRMAERGLEIVWMTLPAAPADILKTVICLRQKSACAATSRRSCRKASLPCTPSCRCH